MQNKKLHVTPHFYVWVLFFAILLGQVLGFQALFISSGGEQNDWSDVGKDILTSVPECDATSQLHHMYDHFKVKIDDAEVWFLCLLLIRSMLLIVIVVRL